MKNLYCSLYDHLAGVSDVDAFSWLGYLTTVEGVIGSRGTGGVGDGTDARCGICQNDLVQTDAVTLYGHAFLGKVFIDGLVEGDSGTAFFAVAYSMDVAGNIFLGICCAVDDERGVGLPIAVEELNHVIVFIVEGVVQDEPHVLALCRKL